MVKKTKATPVQEPAKVQAVDEGYGLNARGMPRKRAPGAGRPTIEPNGMKLERHVSTIDEKSYRIMLDFGIDNFSRGIRRAAQTIDDINSGRFRLVEVKAKVVNAAVGKPVKAPPSPSEPTRRIRTRIAGAKAAKAAVSKAKTSSEPIQPDTGPF